MKLRKEIFLVILFVVITNLVWSQSANNVAEDYHSPRKATIYSTALPGLGQAYNKKYWKIPVIYVGIGSLSYLSIQNQAEFSRYKSAYILRADGGTDEFFGIYNETALLDFMDDYRKNRDLCFIGITVLYIIQIVDANVDANLYNFDISDDLSMRLFPYSSTNIFTRTPEYGFGCKITF